MGNLAINYSSLLRASSTSGDYRPPGPFASGIFTTFHVSLLPEGQNSWNVLNKPNSTACQWSYAPLGEFFGLLTAAAYGVYRMLIDSGVAHNWYRALFRSS